MENDNIETLMEILNEIQFSDSKVMSDNHIVIAWKAVCSLDKQLKFKKINSQDKLIIFFSLMSLNLLVYHFMIMFIKIWNYKFCWIVLSILSTRLTNFLICECYLKWCI